MEKLGKKSSRNKEIEKKIDKKKSIHTGVFSNLEVLRNSDKTKQIDTQKKKSNYLNILLEMKNVETPEKIKKNKINFTFCEMKNSLPPKMLRSNQSLTYKKITSCLSDGGQKKSKTNGKKKKLGKNYFDDKKQNSKKLKNCLRTKSQKRKRKKKKKKVNVITDLTSRTSFRESYKSKFDISSKVRKGFSEKKKKRSKKKKKSSMMKLEKKDRYSRSIGKNGKSLNFEL